MRKIKLSRLILTSFFLLLIIQIAIVGIFGTFSVQESEQREKESVDYILRMYSRNLEGALKQADSDLEEILTHNSSLLLLKNKSQLQRWRASYFLMELMAQKRTATAEVDAYVIMNAEYQGFLISRGSNIVYEDLDYIKKYLLGSFGNGVNNSGWIMARIGEKDYILKNYNLGGNCICALISEKKIKEVLSYGQDGQELIEFYVEDSRGNRICSSAGEGECGEIQEDGFRTETYQFRWYKQDVMDETFYIGARILGSDDVYRVSPYFFIVLVMMQVSVIFIFVLLRLVNHEIIKPINVLSDTSEKIRRGDLTSRPAYFCKNREMTGLRETYITMLDKIMELKLQEYENVIRIKESELKYMHMQLKPHFFLNALSTINSMAYRNENQEIHEFIQVFSHNIRYMFKVGLHTVKLKEEIANVEEYLRMQRLLYRDTFYSYFEVPDDLEEWDVPQMLLHTFIENIFKHAVSMDSFTTIFLQCQMEEFEKTKMLKIEIQNSGKHFNREILERINENKGQAEDGKRGIGLVHTKEILSIMYQREDLLFLENEEPDGVKVTLRIPEKVRMNWGGVRNEFTDRR